MMVFRIFCGIILIGLYYQREKMLFVLHGVIFDKNHFFYLEVRNDFHVK